MSASPPLSPIMGSHRADRQQSHFLLLLQQQLSKRDKRRTYLQDKLDSMQTNFSANRDLHYREQLQAIQVDINLITNANPHSKEVLPDRPDEIDHLVSNEVQRMMMKSMGNNTPLRAGRAYADFAKEVNDAIEERDSALTQHKRNFDVKMLEIAGHHNYKRRLAANEYKALSTTVRDRLINGLTSKKARLSKDKDALEIGNDNSFLLHPSQYSLTNPASPGGIHGKRATRHRREAEELPNFTESHKRKRKERDSDESPAPQRPRLENGASTPVWRAEKQYATLQFEAPLYSIDKLFTEKELTMTYNNAALAAYSFMIRPTQNGDVDSPPNGKSDSSSENGKAIAAGDGDDDEEDSPQGGVGMERQYSHATRSTRGNYLQTNMGMEVFPSLDYPGTLDALSKQIPKMPPVINSLGVRNFARGPDTRFEVNGLSVEDAAAEFDLIRRARAYNDEKGAGRNLDLEIGAKSLLQQASQPRTFRDLLEAFTSPREYNYIATSSAKGLFVDVDQYIPMSSVRDDLGGVQMGVQMSRTSSYGGAAMSRQATGDSIINKKSGRGKRVE